MPQRTLMILATGVLMVFSWTVAAQDKTDAPKVEEKPREKRIQELQEQQRRIQAELAKEGLGGPGAAPGGRGPGSPIFPPGFDPESMRKMMQEQMAKMLEETRARDAARDPRMSPERMNEMLRPGAFPGGAGAGPIDPQSMMAQQMIMMLRMTEAGGGPMAGPEIQDPFEMGQRMVVAGLEAQLRGMAQQIRKTEDKELKAKQAEEFTELVGKLAEARKKRREKQIAQLEKKLEELKAQKDESADDIAKRLLEEPEPKTERPAKPKEE